MSRARSVALLSLAALVTIGLALAALYWQRIALARWLALRELRTRGVPAELRVAQLDLRGAELAEVKLGDPNLPDLALARATLRWSFAGLRAGRLDRIELHGLRLRASLGEDGLSLGSLDALLEAPAGDGEPLTLPFLEAELADAQALIDSQQGALHLQAEGGAQPEGSLVRASFSLRGESPQGALDFGGGGTVDLATQEIAAAGALRGITPWGSVSGDVRALGSLAALRVELRGSVLPDARALPVRADAPLEIEGFVTRDEAGVMAGEARLEGGALAIRELATLSSVAGDVLLRGDAVDATFELRGVDAPDLFAAPAARAHARYALASGELRVELEAAEALAPEIARLSGLAAEVRLAGEALTGTVRVARATELSQPALIAPLRVAADLSGSLGRIALRGTAHTPGDGLAFEISGALEPERERLEMRVVLPETDVSPKTRQPGRVFPWLADAIQGARGKVGGEGLASYEHGELSASAVIALNGADLVTEYATLRGLMGVITATEMDPLVSPPGQRIWMQSVDAGLPLGNGTMRFELRRDGVLAVEEAEWSFAGGKLVFSGAIPLDARERRLELRVEGVSVEQLLAALDFDGLAGTGVLGGVTPLLQSGAALRVNGGELRATETGVIRFTSGEGGAALARKQPALVPVLGALENLQYDELTLTIDGDLSDRVAVRMHIRGRNPNFQKGRPVVLNVNVDLPLGSLLRAAAVATGVPEEIEEQVQKAMGEEKP
ncbi:MAG TPA: YdbH domain-containing protein [Myxococcota bacterium]|nr:YdbH domain-containing protein [Myxococcota bacterium]